MSSNARLQALNEIQSRAGACAADPTHVNPSTVYDMIEGLAQVLIQREEEELKAWAPLTQERTNDK